MRSIVTHRLVLGLQCFPIPLRMIRRTSPLPIPMCHGLPTLLAERDMLLDEIEEFGDLVRLEVRRSLTTTTFAGWLVLGVIVRVGGIMTLLALRGLLTNPGNLQCSFAAAGFGDGCRIREFEVGTFGEWDEGGIDEGWVRMGRGGYLRGTGRRRCSTNCRTGVNGSGLWLLGHGVN